MAEKEGVLRMQPSGRWAVCRPGQEPLEITSREPFRFEYDYQLRDGLRAAVGEQG